FAPAAPAAGAWVGAAAAGACVGTAAGGCVGGAPPQAVSATAAAPRPSPPMKPRRVSVYRRIRSFLCESDGDRCAPVPGRWAPRPPFLARGRALSLDAADDDALDEVTLRDEEQQHDRQQH